MTEFETFEALRMETAFALSTGEQSITLLTGYLLIAFFIGRKLTFFQVSFVNTVFTLMFISSSFTLVSTMPSLLHFVQRLKTIGSEIPIIVGTLNPIFTVAIPVLMYLGAIYFMWTIRHPKEDKQLGNETS